MVTIFFGRKTFFFFPFSFTFSSRRASVRCCAQRVQLARSPQGHYINNINTNRQRRAPYRRCRYLRNFHDFLCSPTNVPSAAYVRPNTRRSTFRRRIIVSMQYSFVPQSSPLSLSLLFVVVGIVSTVTCACASPGTVATALCSRRSTTAPTSPYSGDYPQR